MPKISTIIGGFALAGAGTAAVLYLVRNKTRQQAYSSALQDKKTEQQDLIEAASEGRPIVAPTLPGTPSQIAMANAEATKIMAQLEGDEVDPISAVKKALTKRLRLEYSSTTADTLASFIVDLREKEIIKIWSSAKARIRPTRPVTTVRQTSGQATGTITSELLPAETGTVKPLSTRAINASKFGHWERSRKRAVFGLLGKTNRKTEVY